MTGKEDQLLAIELAEQQFIGRLAERRIDPLPALVGQAAVSYTPLQPMIPMTLLPMRLPLRFPD